MNNLHLQSSKFYQILQALSVERRERFREFMHSPFFNTRPQLVELFEILLAMVADESVKEKLKSAAYEKLFKPDPGGFVYDKNMDGHLRKLLSDLKGLADRFLTVEGFLSKESNGYAYLCESYSELGLERHFELEMAEALKAIPIEKASAGVLMQRHVLETLAYEYVVAKRDWKGIVTLPGPSLMVHYHIERYKQLCEGILVGRVVGSIIDHSFGDSVPDVIPPHLLDAYPVAKFYTLFYKLLHEGEGDFDALRIRVTEMNLEIDREEQKRAYNYLQNYCTGKINVGDLGWRRKLLDVYLDRVVSEGDILPQDLINMVTVAVQEKDIAVAMQLYEDGVKNLVGDSEGMVRHYLEGYLLYAVGEFRKARKKLTGLISLEPWFEFSLRVLEIKTWWEDPKEDDEQALSLIKNLIRNLRRGSKLPSLRREAQKVRFEMAARIIRLREDIQALQALEQKIQQDAELLDRDYLMERIKDYLKE